MKLKLLAVRNHALSVDISLLLLRVTMGYAFILHGWGKIQNPFNWMGEEAGVPGIFQALAALSEFGGGIALILGLLTCLASLGIACTMIVAVFMHAVVMGDPFVNMTGGGAYELALIFLLISILFITAGPGRFSIDRKIFGTK